MGKICEMCGKPIVGADVRRQFCDACREVRERAKKRRYAAKKRGKVLQERGYSPICGMCGEVIEHANMRRRFCDDCLRERGREQKQQYYENSKHGKLQWSSAQKLAETVRKADAAGLSYGQYVALESSRNSRFAVEVKAKVAALELVREK